jgi:4,5-DOPA dioxygenase extradiol
MTPVFFFGHGSPMNAIEDNKFTQKWRGVISKYQKPKSILIISAHWQTIGTKITASEKLETIHDFGGFPSELSLFEYNAKGNPELAKFLADKLDIDIDSNFGLDHGAWSVQIYPDSDIPVLQLSLDYTKSLQEHFEFARELSHLRDQGVMIIGTGNIVHNLGLIDWETRSKNSWARDFQDIINSNVLGLNINNLTNYEQFGQISKQSIPSNEHYLPLLYTLGVSKPSDNIEIFNDEIVMGSISMTSFEISSDIKS